MKTATLRWPFSFGLGKDPNQRRSFRYKNVTRRLWRSEPLSIFGRCQEGLNHFCAIKIAVKLIELGQPEIVTRVV